MFKNVKNKFNLDKVSQVANDFLTNGLKQNFMDTSDIEQKDFDELFDILFGTIHGLNAKEKKALKVIIKTSNEYYYKKFMKEIEISITIPLKEVVEQLSELRKEFYDNGKSK